MQLFVVRHATAEDGQPGQPDASRELTPEGVRKFRRVVRGLRELRWHFDRVITSPWSRATQTAALLAPISDGKPIATDLLCDRPRAELFALIAEVTTAEQARHGTAIVGHQPWLGELIALLAFGDSRHGDALELKKGTVVWLEGTAVAGGMTLRAILPPKLLSALR